MVIAVGAVFGSIRSVDGCRSSVVSYRYRWRALRHNGRAVPKLPLGVGSMVSFKPAAYSMAPLAVLLRVLPEVRLLSPDQCASLDGTG